MDYELWEERERERERECGREGGKREREREEATKPVFIHHNDGQLMVTISQSISSMMTR